MLVRILCKVLDEVCQHEPHGLCHAQQAFVTGRDIIRNYVWAAHEEAAEGDDPLVLLALDCSKGYSRMDHSWRCLRAASTPPEILAFVESLLISMPVLILHGVEFCASSFGIWFDTGWPCFLHALHHQCRPSAVLPATDSSHFRCFWFC